MQPKRLNAHSDGNLREGGDIAGRGKLDGTRPRAVLTKRKMRSGVVMVMKIAR
jgi:hypothetical protein